MTERTYKDLTEDEIKAHEEKTGLKLERGTTLDSGIKLEYVWRMRSDGILNRHSRIAEKQEGLSE